MAFEKLSVRDEDTGLVAPFSPFVWLATETARQIMAVPLSQRMHDWFRDNGDHQPVWLIPDYILGTEIIRATVATKLAGAPENTDAEKTGYLLRAAGHLGSLTARIAANNVMLNTPRSRIHRSPREHLQTVFDVVDAGLEQAKRAERSTDKIVEDLHRLRTQASIGQTGSDDLPVVAVDSANIICGRAAKSWLRTLAQIEQPVEFQSGVSLRIPSDVEILPELRASMPYIKAAGSRQPQFSF